MKKSGDSNCLLCQLKEARENREKTLAYDSVPQISQLNISAVDDDISLGKSKKNKDDEASEEIDWL